MVRTLRGREFNHSIEIGNGFLESAGFEIQLAASLTNDRRPGSKLQRGGQIADAVIKSLGSLQQLRAPKQRLRIGRSFGDRLVAKIERRL
jgi:hypothetical protein